MHFYANGKLLLTGEYFVMKGALSLALPVRSGQQLEVVQGGETGLLKWKAFEEGHCWFEAIFTLPDIEIKETNSKERAEYLCNLLKAGQQLNSNFLRGKEGLSVETNLNYPLKWGLGSSSTLVYLISQWAQVNKYKLHAMVSKGSGYDIACASGKTPLLYQRSVDNKPEVANVNLSNSITQHIYFVYSGRKMATEQHIGFIFEKIDNQDKRIEKLSSITKEIIQTNRLDRFEELLSEHEIIISEFLKTPPIKQKYFSDFKGALKSLGAWGGDFFMAVTTESELYMKQYFEQFKLSVIISYNKMIQP